MMYYSAPLYVPTNLCKTTDTPKPTVFPLRISLFSNESGVLSAGLSFFEIDQLPLNDIAKVSKQLNPSAMVLQDIIVQMCSNVFG